MLFQLSPAVVCVCACVCVCVRVNIVEPLSLWGHSWTEDTSLNRTPFPTPSTTLACLWNLGHLANNDTFFCPIGVLIGEVPLYMLMCYQCVCEHSNIFGVVSVCECVSVKCECGDDTSVTYPSPPISWFQTLSETAVQSTRSAVERGKNWV